MIDRRESITGTISVIDDLEGELRLMKVDHSLLGGYYTDEEVGSVGCFRNYLSSVLTLGMRGLQIAQHSSIYSIFYVHEAVRLARPQGSRFLQM